MSFIGSSGGSGRTQPECESNCLMGFNECMRRTIPIACVSSQPSGADCRLAIVMRRYMVDVRRSRRFLSFGRKHVKSIDGASNGANSCRIRKLYKLQWTQMLHRIRQSRRQFAPNEFDLIWHQFRVERDRTRGDRGEMGHRVVLRLESTMQSINGPLLPATHFSLHTKPFSLYLGPHFCPRERVQPALSCYALLLVEEAKSNSQNYTWIARRPKSKRTFDREKCHFKHEPRNR